MSGSDEVTIVPQCPKCHRASSSYYIRERRTDMYGNHEYTYGTIGYRMTDDGSRNVLLVIGKNNIENIEPEKYIQSLKERKILYFYGFRCVGCNYLFTVRRLKTHYLNLLDSIQTCLRRNQIVIERLFRW